jgi:pantoate kinase
MATTPEAKVKAKIKAILKEHNVYFAMPIGSGFGNAGVPDFLCCAHGYFIAIEAKAGKGKTTALQDKHIKQIAESSGIALVINENNMDELVFALNSATQANNKLMESFK